MAEDYIDESNMAVDWAGRRVGVSSPLIEMIERSRTRSEQPSGQSEQPAVRHEKPDGNSQPASTPTEPILRLSLADANLLYNDPDFTQPPPFNPDPADGHPAKSFMLCLDQRANPHAHETEATDLAFKAQLMSHATYLWKLAPLGPQELARDPRVFASKSELLDQIRVQTLCGFLGLDLAGVRLATHHATGAPVELDVGLAEHAGPPWARVKSFLIEWTGRVVEFRVALRFVGINAAVRAMETIKEPFEEGYTVVKISSRPS